MVFLSQTVHLTVVQDATYLAGVIKEAQDMLPDLRQEYEEVMRQLDGRIDGIVKGTCGCMSASTIIDLSQDEVKVLREGPITKAQIEEALAR